MYSARNPFRVFQPRVGQLGPLGPPNQIPTRPDVPPVRLPTALTCRLGGCTLYNMPATTSLVVASLVIGTKLTRVGPVVFDMRGAPWVEVQYEYQDNFNVRTGRGYVQLSEIAEAPASSPPAPPPAPGPGPNTDADQPTPPVTAQRSTLQTLGEVALLTAPAWGAFLFTRLLR